MFSNVAPEQRQTTHSAQKILINRNPVLLCQFVVSFITVSRGGSRAFERGGGQIYKGVRFANFCLSYRIFFLKLPMKIIILLTQRGFMALTAEPRYSTPDPPLDPPLASFMMDLKSCFP